MPREGVNLTRSNTSGTTRGLTMGYLERVPILCKFGGAVVYVSGFLLRWLPLRYTTDCVNMIKDVNAYVNKRNGKLKRKDALILVHCR